MTSLHDRARDQLVPEPIVFVVDAPGVIRFASDQLPWRAIIDVRGGIIFGTDMRVNEAAGTVTITAGDRMAIYDRTGVTLGGAWICNLRADTRV